MIEIQVKDTGCGIKREDFHKLFLLFGFLDNTKELNAKGIGLGLHISKMICQEFGGDIIVNSEWGHGTNFTFVFALSDPKNINFE